MKIHGKLDGTITQEQLKNVLRYDQDSGEFTRITKGNEVRAGHVKNGYIKIQINRKSYLAHRLAWLYIHGVWPKCFIDHINGDKKDNRISNLRESDYGHNSCNQRKAQRQNSTGYLGVTKMPKCFRAVISYQKVMYHLGVFKTAEEAHEAYLNAKRRLHPSCSI